MPASGLSSRCPVEQPLFGGSNFSLFFIVSELVESLLFPSNLIALLGLPGVVASVIRWKRLAIWLLCASTVLLGIAGWSPLGPALVMPLENRFSAPEMPASVTGIVMLGGAEDTHITGDIKNVTLNDNSERIFQTAALARRYPQARIVLSGGGGNLIVGEGETESQIARRVLVDLGIPSERIETEQHSRTTFENAVESMAVAKPAIR